MDDVSVAYVLSVDVSLECASSLEIILVHIAGTAIFLGWGPRPVFRARLPRSSGVHLLNSSWFAVLSVVFPAWVTHRVRYYKHAEGGLAEGHVLTKYGNFYLGPIAALSFERLCGFCYWANRMRIALWLCSDRVETGCCLLLGQITS